MILGVSFVTIYFNTEIEDPFNTPKLIVLLLLAGWIFGHLINSYREESIKVKSSEFNALSISIIFIVALLASTLFTDLKLVGFIGDTQRRNGFLAYFGLVIIFLYASRTINWNYAFRIVKVSIFVGAVISAYGLMQVLGKDFVDWNNPYNAMISTVGNPNFASALLAILFLISFGGLFLKSLPVFYKVISVLVLITSFYSIVKSDSRQGIIAILFAIMSCLAIYSYLHHRKLRFFVLPTLMFTGIFAIFGMLQKGPLAPILYKDSVSVRGYYWRAGIEMFREKPFTGIGVDRYGAYFKEFREVGYPLKYGYEITSSNAHNTIIQLFSTAGIFVGLSYLAIILYVFISGIKAIKKSDGDQQRVALVLLSAWIGFQSQSFISIDNIGISVWGWLLGGSILGLSRKNGSILEAESPKLKGRNIVKINLFQPIVSIMILIPISIICFFLYSSEKDSYEARSFAASATPEAKNFLINSANAVYSNPLSDPFYKFKVSLVLSDAGYSEESYNELKNLLIYDPRNLYYHGALAYFAAKNGDIELAIKSNIQITKLDPWNAVNFVELGIRYSEIGNKAEARKMFQRVLDFAPNSEQASLAKDYLEKL